MDVVRLINDTLSQKQQRHIFMFCPLILYSVSFPWPNNVLDFYIYALIWLRLVVFACMAYMVRPNMYFITTISFINSILLTYNFTLKEAKHSPLFIEPKNTGWIPQLMFICTTYLIGLHWIRYKILFSQFVNDWRIYYTQLMM